MFLFVNKMSSFVIFHQMYQKVKMIRLIPRFSIEFFKDETTIELNSFPALAISMTFQQDMIELLPAVEFSHTGKLVSRVYNFCVFNYTGQQNTFTLSPNRMSVKMVM